MFSVPEDPLEKEMWLCREVYAEEGYLIVSPSGCCAPEEVPAQCSLWALAWMLPGTACVEAGRVVKQSLREAGSYLLWQHCRNTDSFPWRVSAFKVAFEKDF